MPVILPCLLAFVFAKQEPASDREVLTQGVGQLVAKGGVPGVICASGLPAFVVLTGRSGGSLVPLFVAARIGKGRAMAGGHGCFFGSAQLEDKNNLKFFLNSMAWLGGKPIQQTRVGFLGVDAPQDVLDRFAMKRVNLARATVGIQLPDVDVLCMSQGALDGDPSGQSDVMQFVRQGGGLFVCGPAWGWQQLNPGRDLLRDLSANRMLGDFGVHMTGATADGPFSPAGAADPEMTTSGALEVLQQPGVTQPRVRNGIATLDLAIQITAPNDTSLLNQIAALAKKEGSTEPIPTLRNPATWATPFARLEARLDVNNWRSAAPESIKKHPTADAFPGPVPASASRITKKIEVDTGIYGWHAVGMYACPGEVVTVTIPDSAISAALSLRIGPHTDSLWHLDSWQRFPEISQSTVLNRSTVKTASPFGGLIYLDVPKGCILGPVTVKIENAIASPLYELGNTSPAGWSESRLAVAPWADLVGKHVSISLPASAIRKLDNPGALMRYWDTVMVHCCELYSVPLGGRQERYCVDRQIGGGYMHSGYPIMTWEDVADTFADLSKLTSMGKTWGFYHEMGHNFQQSDWTFEGTGEVTNNLFSVYGNETLNGITPANFGQAHPALEAGAMRDRLAKYLAAGAPYKQWKDDPFLALTMYLELRVGFGWDPFKKVFAEYRGLAREDRPKTDEEKRDQWMVRFSKTIHRNLGPFFVAWGVPTSETARSSIDALPTWMPADWPGKEK